MGELFRRRFNYYFAVDWIGGEQLFTVGCGDEHAGFDGWTELRTRPDRDPRTTVQQYKMEERIAVEKEPEGYTIIANIGDQISDIDGGHGGCTFKVPNPFYFIP